MEGEKKRYRTRVKQTLCLTPHEALATGVSVGGETIEWLLLVPGPLVAPGYAAIRTEPEDVLAKLTPTERGERFFAGRMEAMEYIRGFENGMFRLYGVRETHLVKRENIGAMGDTGRVEDIMRQLQEFEIGGKKKKR
jgi:hypothetical protein